MIEINISDLIKLIGFIGLMVWIWPGFDLDPPEVLDCWDEEDQE